MIDSNFINKSTAGKITWPEQYVQAAYDICNLNLLENVGTNISRESAKLYRERHKPRISIVDWWGWAL